MPKNLPPLALCIGMDLIGYFSYAVPLFAELADVVWAPISGLIFYAVFRGWKGTVGGLVSFAEEFLPGTDFIPSFTLMWLWLYFQQPKNLPEAKVV